METALENLLKEDLLRMVSSMSKGIRPMNYRPVDFLKFCG